MTYLGFFGEYRTESGRCYFCWYFEQQGNGEVRAYIEDAPFYGSRSSDGHSTHRYCINGCHYICYEPMPRSFDDAVNIAKAWAERTERYILCGTTF